MAESTLSMTYTDIAGAVGVLFSYGATVASFTATEAEQVAVAIRRGLRQFYFPPILEDRAGRPLETSAHKWSFLHPAATITSNAPYSTGTVTIVDGVVTLASGTWPTWAAYGLLSINSTLYEVSTRDSGSQITLVDTTLDADALSTYTLYQGNAAAPDNFGGFDDDPTYATPTVYEPELTILDESQIRALRGSSGSTFARPQFVATRVVNATSTSGQRWQFLFWPAFDAAYVLEYTYHVLPDMISGTQYPLGGSAHAETILSSCLSAAAEMLKDQEGFQRKRSDFMTRLRASVAHDRQRMTADKLMSDRELVDYDWRNRGRPRGLTATYSGF